MIEGVVTDAREAVLDLLVWGPEGRQREIEAVIDTGFSGYLTVTPGLASELGLVFEGQARATLADGSQTMFPYYGVSVRWDGQDRYVEAGAADTTPLVGMRLLENHSLFMEIEDGGRVVIEAR
ncbi:MAG: clan AA aspartic protease [Chloroflexota bacterium]|nr:clan AA aspartic protease [Chloroflexota bacterium]